jgi:hypothetical protein
MAVRHPHPPSPAGWAPPSPALRERVPSAARRVRARSPDFIYREPLTSGNAQQECSPAPPRPDRCRAAHVVGAAGSSLVAIQISPSASDRRLYRRLRLYPARVGDRDRWRAARGQWGRCPSNCLARKSGLDGDPFLEQRCPQQHRWGTRHNPKDSTRRVDPHPPSPAGLGPSLSRDAGEGLLEGSLVVESPSPALRERVPRAARRVRASPR